MTKRKTTSPRRDKWTTSSYANSLTQAFCILWQFESLKLTFDHLIDVFKVKISLSQLFVNFNLHLIHNSMFFCFFQISMQVQQPTDEIMSIYDTLITLLLEFPENMLGKTTYCCEEQHMKDYACTPNIVLENDPVHKYTGIRCMNSTRPLTYQDFKCTNDEVPSPVSLFTLKNIILHHQFSRKTSKTDIGLPQTPQ